MNKKPVSFVMDDEDWKELEKIAEAQKTSVSTIIRQAIHEKIDKESK